MLTSPTAVGQAATELIPPLSVAVKSLKEQALATEGVAVVNVELLATANPETAKRCIATT